MKKDSWIIMNKYPDEDYSRKYCKEAGLVVGGVYIYGGEVNMHTVFIKVRIDSVDPSVDPKWQFDSDKTDYFVHFGVRFFEQHFKVWNRIENLEKLGI